MSILEWGQLRCQTETMHMLPSWSFMPHTMPEDIPLDSLLP